MVSIRSGVRAIGAAFVIAALSTAQPSQAQKVSAAFKDMRQDIEVQIANINGKKTFKTMTIQEAMDYHRVEGAAIVTIVNGKIERIARFGFRNSQTKLPVDAATIFPVASMSKLPAAVAMIEAAQSGEGPLLGRVVGKIVKADPGNELSSWYAIAPKIFWNMASGAPNGPSIRRLLNHTAGLGRHGVGTSLASCNTRMSTVLNGNSDCNEAGTLPLTMPGIVFDYSGGGYTVAEAALEAVSGKDAATILQEKVLDPFGMKRSTYARASPTMTNLARACFDRGLIHCDQFVRFTNVKFAGGLLAHPVEYARFVNVLMHDGVNQKGQRIVSLETIQDLLTPAWHRDSTMKACTASSQCTAASESCVVDKCRKPLTWSGQGYALGVKVEDAYWNGLPREFHHGGSQPGVATGFWADRKEKKAIVVLSVGDKEFADAGHPPPLTSGLPGSSEFVDDILAAWKRSY